MPEGLIREVVEPMCPRGIHDFHHWRRDDLAPIETHVCANGCGWTWTTTPDGPEFTRPRGQPKGTK